MDQKGTPNLDASIRTVVRAELRAALRELGLDAVALRYSTSNPPPGTKPRTFNAVCRSGVVVGAEKDGREWSCTTEAWRAARRRPARVAPPKLELVEAVDPDEELAGRVAASLGRSTRGGGR